MEKIKCYEAADLTPDTYCGEYFQPSVPVYKKKDVDDVFRTTNDVILGLVAALGNIVLVAKDCNWDKYLTGRQLLLSDAEKALAQAHKHLGENES